MMATPEGSCPPLSTNSTTLFIIRLCFMNDPTPAKNNDDEPSLTSSLPSWLPSFGLDSHVLRQLIGQIDGERKLPLAKT